MTLFGFGKKQKEEGLPAACQCGGCTAQKDACRQEQKEKDCCGGAWNIRVWGTGCAACHALLENTKKAVEMIAGKYETESSGGITFDTIRDYAECGVDYISVGALTHSVKGLDMSFKAC